MFVRLSANRRDNDAMHTIELSDYIIAPYGTGNGISGFYFSLDPGNVCAIDADNPDDAHALLRALASLLRPTRGVYRYSGRVLNWKNFYDTLHVKQKIGYIAPDAALISNLTIRQNLLLRRFYFENRLDIRIDDETRSLCRELDIYKKLDLRPSGLNAMEIQAAIVIREACKKPDVFLLNRPETFIGHTKFDILVALFNQWIDEKIPIVFCSYDRRLIRRFANRQIIVTNGSLTTVDIK